MISRAYSVARCSGVRCVPCRALGDGEAEGEGEVETLRMLPRTRRLLPLPKPPTCGEPQPPGEREEE